MEQELKSEFQHFYENGCKIRKKQEENERLNLRKLKLQSINASRFEIIQEKGDNKELDDSERHCAVRIWTDKRTCDVVHRADSDEELHRMIEGRD